jgi:twinkle protein
MYSKISIDKIKDASNIVQVVGGYLELKKNGANYICLSPFSNEKSPSFTVSESKNIYKCFSTGKSGDCINFLMEYKKINYIEALKVLSEKYVIPLEDEKDAVKLKYIRPIWKNNTMLSDKLIKWFETQRKISQNTLIDLKISEGIEWMPNKKTGISGNVNTMQFNYFIDNELINTKFRDSDKNFKLVSGSELVMFNLDAIKNETTCIIVEGEMDVLALYECGVKNVISVPNGATKGKNNLTYLDNSIIYLEHITDFILALDNDENGNKLKDEIARRLGFENCKIATFKDCKDANDCLIKYGITETFKCTLFDNLTDFPIVGVFNSHDIEDEIMDYYNNGLPEGKGVNMPEIDTYLKFHLGYLTMITGIPGHGKSEFLDFLICRLNISQNIEGEDESDNGWKTAFYSPENHPLQLHFSKLAEKLTGKSFDKKSVNRITPEELRYTIDYCANNFYFINPEDDFSINSILDRVKELIKRKGVKAFVIDAWNKLDHIRGAKDKNDYISETLDTITKFCERNLVHCFLVAHPKKMGKDKDGNAIVPELYDISDSAHFYNKTANGISVYRDFVDGDTQIHIQKVKFKHWGQTQTINLGWNYINGRYYKGNYNNDSWIYKEIEPKQPEVNADFLTQSNQTQPIITNSGHTNAF